MGCGFHRPVAASWSCSRSKVRRGMLCIVAAAASLGSAQLASGALWIWDGGDGNDDCGSAANWATTAPTNDASTDLEFGSVALQAPLRTTANNTVSTFNGNKITFNGTAGGSFIIS